MSEGKKFYVNFATGKVISNALDCCSTMPCKDCIYDGTCGCTAKLKADPEGFLRKMGYVPFPFDILEKSAEGKVDSNDEAHLVIFPRANIPTVFRLTNDQMNLVDKLNEMDILAYDEVAIEDM